MDAVKTLVGKFESLIVNPAILIIFALGFFLFVYGLVEFLWALNDDGRGQRNQAGKQHMLWGIVGMLIMVSVYGILDLLDGTFGLDYRNPDVTRIQNIPAPPNFGG